MKRTGIFLLTVLFLALGSSAAAEDGPAAPKKAGYGLLDMYIGAFQDMAARGTGGAELEGRLQAMAAEAKRVKDSGEVNLVFFARYSRILALTALVVGPDKGNLLAPVIDRELRAFLRDVTGEDIVARQGPAAVGQVANAIAEELVNLQLYLDTLDKREAIRKKLDEGMSASPKKDG